MAQGLLDEVMTKAAPGRPPVGPSESSQIQMMQAVKAQPTASSQQLGAAMASQAGKEQLQKTQAALNETVKTKEQGLQQQQLASQQDIATKELALQQLVSKNKQRIAELDKAAANQIFNENRQFVRDEANRQYLNQQMLDQYAMYRLQSEEQRKDYVNNVNMFMQRKAAYMQANLSQIEGVIQRGYMREQADLDMKQMEYLTKVKADYERQLVKAKEKEMKRQANKGMMVQAFTTAGMIVGGVVAGAYTGGTGTAAGAGVGMAAGAAVGGLLGTAVANQ